MHIYPSKLGNVPTKKVSCASRRKASLRSCGVFAICRATLALGFAFALALAPAFAFALGSPPDPGAAPWITFTSSCKLGPPDDVEDPLVRASWDIWGPLLPQFITPQQHQQLWPLRRWKSSTKTYVLCPCTGILSLPKIWLTRGSLDSLDQESHLASLWILSSAWALSKQDGSISWVEAEPLTSENTPINL